MKKIKKEKLPHIKKNIIVPLFGGTLLYNRNQLKTEVIYLNEYKEFLEKCDFNEKQIELILKVRRDFDNFEKEYNTIKFEEDYCYLLDNFERDLWSTFNNSGLFEKDDKENIYEIHIWDQEDTRTCITELEVKPFNKRARLFPL